MALSAKLTLTASLTLSLVTSLFTLTSHYSLSLSLHVQGQQPGENRTAVSADGPPTPLDQLMPIY
jgi:hypothetical protein